MDEDGFIVDGSDEYVCLQCGNHSPMEQAMYAQTYVHANILRPGPSKSIRPEVSEAKMMLISFSISALVSIAFMALLSYIRGC
jgi:uncharacterized membrane protein YvbJ